MLNLSMRVAGLWVIFLVAVAAESPGAETCEELWEETHECDDFDLEDFCLGACDNAENMCRQWVEVIEPEVEECCEVVEAECFEDTCGPTSDKHNCDWEPRT